MTQPGEKVCDHHESLYGRCTACGMTWAEQSQPGESDSVVTDAELGELDRLIRFMVQLDLPNLPGDDVERLTGHLVGAVCVWSVERSRQAGDDA